MQRKTRDILKVKLRRFAVCVGFGTAMAVPAHAHPHVFIDARAEFRFNTAEELDKIRITWIYDAFTSLTLMAILDLDDDNDTVLSEADRARIVQAQTIWPDDFEGDTYLETAGQSVGFGKPLNGSSDMLDGRIWVSFDLPLLDPLVVTDAVELRLFDPTYYYAYSAIGVGSSNACDAEVRPFEPSAATSGLQAQLVKLSREETPEQENVGRLFADVITLTCN
ncbi:MAG: DUF1007 family protein [Pseudomonadota bacterium]